MTYPTAPSDVLSNPSPSVRRRRSPVPGIAALYAILLFACTGLALFTGYEFYFRDRVVLGVTVLGQHMSGLTRTEARQFLQDRFGQPEAIVQQTGGEPIVLRDGNQTWRAWPWELGLRTEFGPIADSALLLGHRGTVLENLIEQARCMWLGCDLGLDAQFDLKTAQAYLSALAKQVNRPPRDASIKIDDLQVIVTPAQTGRELNTEAMLDRVRERVLGSDRGEIPLAFHEKKPQITDVETAKKQAEAILAEPIMLTFGARAWALDQGALAKMLTVVPKPGADGKPALSVSLDHNQLVTYLKMLAREINQPARDARFHFDPSTGALTPIVTSQYGQTLDTEAAARQVEQRLVATAPRTQGLASPVNEATVRTVTLPVTTTKPAIAMEDAGKFGIKELVSQGVSNFKGSSPGRVQNVRTAAAQFDGIVVPPGATFSFVQYLGEVVEANGYDDAYVIFQDRTVLGPGGGVCQVSTTLFRAAFFGGFPIVERWAHAYRVGYYEPPVGLDATVFAPSVDMKFQNDTNAYLLIEPILDVKATTLKFNLYGTKPNRTVEMADPIKEKIIPHGPDVYTPDATLKKGVTKQVDTAHDGMDVTIWRTIKVNGQVVKKDKFFSRYDPWVARFLVGTR